MPIATARPRPKAMARVAVTRTPRSAKLTVSVGRRKLRGHSPQMNSQKPRIISAKPSVATARTIGSLCASRGAIKRPYNRAKAVEAATAAIQPSHCGKPESAICHASSALKAPSAPWARLRTPEAR